MSSKPSLDASIKDHLSEHIPYSVMMLRYASHRLCQCPPLTAIDWNAYYECWAVHARLLANFLTNNSDQTRFRITDLTAGYQYDTGGVAPILGQLNVQVMHFNPDRTKDNAKKINGADVAALTNWIEGAIAKFKCTLRKEYREFWGEENTDPHCLTQQTKTAEFLDIDPNAKTTNSVSTAYVVFSPRG